MKGNSVGICQDTMRNSSTKVIATNTFGVASLHNGEVDFLTIATIEFVLIIHVYIYIIYIYMSIALILIAACLCIHSHHRLELKMWFVFGCGGFETWYCQSRS